MFDSLYDLDLSLYASIAVINYFSQRLQFSTEILIKFLNFAKP